MKELKGSQKKYLRGIAHDLKPSAFVGHKGITESLINEIDEALGANELIKVKFIDFKEKNIKRDFAMEIAEQTQSSIAGIIGHVVIYYKENKEPEKRRIKLPA